MSALMTSFPLTGNNCRMNFATSRKLNIYNNNKKKKLLALSGSNSVGILLEARALHIRQFWCRHFRSVEINAMSIISTETSHWELTSSAHYNLMSGVFQIVSNNLTLWHPTQLRAAEWQSVYSLNVVMNICACLTKHAGVCLSNNCC